MLGIPPTRSATLLRAPSFSGRVAVVSPHLDDAILSLGASLRAATRRGVSVDVVTVLAGDPHSTAPADENNQRAGFRTAGEAARRRREEDRRACEAVGAQPIWLDLSDDRNEAWLDEGTLARSLSAALKQYDAVLLPGYPLAHRDHLRISTLLMEILEPGRTLGLYAEQPYASWQALSRSNHPFEHRTLDQCLALLRLSVSDPPRWTREHCRPADWVAKWRGMGSYESQLAVLRSAPRLRILAYEVLHRGETILWLRTS